MNAKTRTIEIDETTAQVLHKRAAERGVSVSQIISEYALAETSMGGADAEMLSELDRRWQKVRDGEKTVSGERVAAWLETWGTPGFRPWHKS